METENKDTKQAVSERAVKEKNPDAGRSAAEISSEKREERRRYPRNRRQNKPREEKKSEEKPREEKPREGKSPEEKAREGKPKEERRQAVKPETGEENVQRDRRRRDRRRGEHKVAQEAGNEAETPKETKTPKEPKEPKAPAAAESPRESKPRSYEVIGVRFKQTGKIYYFDPNGMTFRRDDHVIVDTARGIEYGIVSTSNRLVPAKEVVLPLRKAVRAANEEDEQRREANREQEVEAFNLCLSKIEERRLDMKLVDVEVTFDNAKMLFYYTSEGRVDFRELVKDLASMFRTRIEMRQIGIRDEAKLMGGLGVCGRPFCCASFLSDFVQVSIKMAKEQNLSLNSSKISGACGRLMCCLRYEYDTYAEEIAKTPKVDSLVSTPDGDGVVTEVSPLAGLCKVVLNKDPSSVQLYHRDDLKVKGSAKGKRKSGDANASESSAELKKLEDKG